SAKGKCSVTFLRKLMKELRKSKLRRPDIVYDNWEPVLYAESGNEMWNLYEQLCVAALDYGDVKLADECITLLLNKFPNSARVVRLLGLKKEQCGDYEEALEVYSGLLATNPANLMVLKRKVCVYKAMGDVKGEIEEINSLLKQYPSEAASWQELGEIYLSMCDNAAAAHCFQELVLLAPISAPAHTRLADAYYAVGDLDALVLSRKHYSISLTNQAPRHNLRALYGLIYACNAVAAKSKDKDGIEHELQVNAELLTWGKEQLQSLATGSSDCPIQTVHNAIV
ncbi:hypothetical protein B484DRAFT_460311, partial [Ochromonadaceae sp. CCMP2298]